MGEKKDFVFDEDRAAKTPLGYFTNFLGKPGWILLALRVLIYIIQKIIGQLNGDDGED